MDRNVCISSIPRILLVIVSFKSLSNPRTAPALPRHSGRTGAICSTTQPFWWVRSRLCSPQSDVCSLTTSRMLNHLTEVLSVTVCKIQSRLNIYFRVKSWIPKFTTVHFICPWIHDVDTWLTFSPHPPTQLLWILIIIIIICGLI